MRRKSERNKSKSSPEKKPAESSRKSRRQSRRRKRSSSHSASDDSDEAPLKVTIVAPTEPEISPPSDTPKKSSNSNSEEENQEQPIWKVKTADTSSGEIQKIKICLTRPPSTPERTERSPRRRKPKVSSLSEDPTSDEKPSRRRTRRSSPVASTEDNSSQDNSCPYSESAMETEKDECLIIVKETNEAIIGEGKLGSSQLGQESENDECVQNSQKDESQKGPASKPDHELVSNVQPEEPVEVHENQTAVPVETTVPDVEMAEEAKETSEIIKSDQDRDKPTDLKQPEAIEKETTHIIEAEKPPPEVKPIPKVVEASNVEEPTKIARVEEKVVEKEAEEVKELKTTENTPKTIEKATEEKVETEVKPSEQTVEVKPVEIVEAEVKTTDEKVETIEKPIEEKVAETKEAETEVKSTEEKVETEEKPVETSKVDEKPTEVVKEIEKVEEKVQEIVPEQKPEKKIEESKKEETEQPKAEKVIEKPKMEQDQPKIVEEPKTEIEEQLKTEKPEIVEASEKKEEQPQEKMEVEEIKQVENNKKVEQKTVEAKTNEEKMDSESKEETKVEAMEIEEVKEKSVEKKNEEKTEEKVVDKKEPEGPKPAKIIEGNEDKDPKCEAPLSPWEAKEESPKIPLRQKSEDRVIPMNPEPCEESPVHEEIVHQEEELVRRKRRTSWSKSTKAKLPETDFITTESILKLCPTAKMLTEDELKLETEEAVKEEKKTPAKVLKIEEGPKQKIEVVIPPPSPKEEEVEKEVFNIGLNRKISIVDDEASKLQPPPSPPKNPVSSILFITNLVRPFTLKQLKELLSRTGKLLEEGFWTDRIKSKCYVQYETEEEAEATRNALHGVQWPIGNGKKLVIDFGTLEALDAARKPTVTEPIPKPVPEKVVEKPVVPEVKKDVSQRWEKERPKAPVREWDLGKVPQEDERRRGGSRERERERDKNRDRSRSEKSRDRSDKRRHPSPSNGEHVNERKIKKVEDEDIPARLMDDLFHKTKATPSIYWLPLTPEMIALKQQERLQRMAEHKRRLEESRRGGRDFGRGAPRSRRRSGRFDGD